ncbi:MAG: hypothetical protein WDO56_30105 [Gammaproteobacteria bacterium]
MEAAVFRSVWDYPLVQVRLPTPGLTGLINAGRTITDGVEASSSLKLTDAWSFTIGGGYRKTTHALTQREPFFRVTLPSGDDRVGGITRYAKPFRCLPTPGQFASRAGQRSGA